MKKYYENNELKKLSTQISLAEAFCLRKTSFKQTSKNIEVFDLSTIERSLKLIWVNNRGTIYHNNLEIGVMLTTIDDILNKWTSILGFSAKIHVGTFYPSIICSGQTLPDLRGQIALYLRKSALNLVQNY